MMLLCVAVLVCAGPALGVRSALRGVRQRRYRMSDDVAQGLVTVRYALEAGEHEVALSAAAEAYASSSALMAGFLPRVRPGGLRRAADA